MKDLGNLSHPKPLFISSKNPAHRPSVSVFESSVCFTIPFLNKDRVQFKLNTIDFLNLPASESKEVIIERTAAVCTDIEG